MRNRLCCGPPLLSGGGPQSDSFVVVVYYGGKFIKNRGLSKEKWSMFAICALADDIGLKCCLDVYWKPEVGPFTMKNVHQLKNDSDVFNILEFIPTNQNVHIYLADNVDRGELFEDCSKAEELEVVSEVVSDAVEKDANIEEPKIVAEDANFEESRDDAREHDATCNVEESDETIDVHTCEKVMKNPNITCKFIAKTYLHKFQIDRNYAPSLLKANVEVDYVAILNGTKCHGARKLALEMIDVSYKEEFKKLYDYLGDLRETSPGTTTICQLDDRLFERVYICPQACKNGYSVGCMPVISLDGCFLKGLYIGWLLATIGIDGNDGIYPIAYVVVESENFSAWYWF
ncbi:hypothetical protein GQ457_07G008790 [Hibiscus cannabinus]